jgi:hypothetical protein
MFASRSRVGGLDYGTSGFLLWFLLVGDEWCGLDYEMTVMNKGESA